MAVDLGLTLLFAIANLDDQIVVPSEVADPLVLVEDLGALLVLDPKPKDLKDLKDPQVQGLPEDVHLLAVPESETL